LAKSETGMSKYPGTRVDNTYTDGPC